MCVDSAGNLWIAIWGGGQVRCYSPAGERAGHGDGCRPANTTSVAFIGAELDTLLITTAHSEGLIRQQLAESRTPAGCSPPTSVSRGHPVTPWQNRPIGGGAAS